MAKKTVKFMLTAFRDGFQSVVGARVLSKDFLPCVEEAYAAGVRWFEAGGGARFQSCYFYSSLLRSARFFSRFLIMYNVIRASTTNMDIIMMIPRAD